MFDAIYVLATVAFFALLLAYVRACAAVGRVAGSVAPGEQRSRVAIR